jgi:hypothetical protein
MAPSPGLLPLSAILWWARRKAKDEEVGAIADPPLHPLAICHNELDRNVPPSWSFTETLASDGTHDYRYPSDLRQAVALLQARFPCQRVTAGQLITILEEVQAAGSDEDVPLSAPVGTRVVITPEGKDYHGAGCGCERCNSNGHAYEYRIHDVSRLPASLAPGSALPDELLDELHLDDNLLHVLWAPSEEAAERNCELECRKMGWIVLG